jgi:diadenosine tetraphosphatase ApaH/serine/threonine PP2A family protein phosphatase
MIGHSHLPFVIERVPSGEMITYKYEARLGKNERYIINAGSVGQPRDRDPRACYAIFDDDMLEFVRLEYAIEKTQRKMHDAGLPLMLIERLSKGT